MTLLEQEVFCECGSWKNFLDLEESLSLDELIVLYEAASERQQRLIKAVAASMGAEMEDSDHQKGFLYSDEEDKSEIKSEHKPYKSIYASDIDTGGAVTPVFGANEVNALPINLGYSIIEE